MCDNTRDSQDSDFARSISYHPSQLCSPTHLLHTRRANCFELASFLVCLLLGQGYNAYVVSGYASREQTQCDQTRRVCPYLPAPIRPPTPTVEVDKSKYRPRSPPDFSSKFIEAMEESERRRKIEEIEKREEQRQRMIMELERPSADRLFGQRIHAWVLLLPNAPGPRSAEISEPLFVEPSTGLSYSPRDLDTANLYLGVESIWNNRNYWVNMQDCSEACTKLEWDLSSVQSWEHLLAGEPEDLRNVDDDEDEEVNTRRNFHMVMPASYVGKIDIAYADYEKRYPNGSKTIYYKKAKVELSAPYVRIDGLVQSVTTFEDYEYKTPLHVYEKFEYRGDCLERTEKDLTKETVTDFYGKGRPDACKTHHYFISSRNAVDEERTLEFHDGKRLDDLLRQRMHPLYASQEYKRRDDRLFNRYVEYSPYSEGDAESDIHYRAILKIVERFERNHDVPAGRDVAIREFDSGENEIRLTYHYQDGQYTQATRTFIKPPPTERGEQMLFLPEMTHGYNPDPMAPPEDFDDLAEELERQLREEDASIVEVRNAERQVNAFLRIRDEEYAEPRLEISMFDPIRNHEARAGLLAMEEKAKAQSRREIEGEVDFVAPYLSRFGDLRYLTHKQALAVRSDCMGDFERTLVSRANDILRQFDESSGELEKLQAALTQTDGLSREEKEELFEQASKMNVKLRALEVRLNRHRELVAARYRKLIDALQRNQQLSIIYDEERVETSGALMGDWQEHRQERKK